MNKDEYTGAQRLVWLFIKLLAGAIINPTEYAHEMGIERQTVYHQLYALSGMGIPVTNEYGRGKWGLMKGWEGESWLKKLDRGIRSTKQS